LEKAENIDYKNAAFKEQVEKLDKNKPVLFTFIQVAEVLPRQKWFLKRLY
jgi:hypothetical protein